MREYGENYTMRNFMFYSEHNIVRAITQRMMRYARRTPNRGDVYKILVGNSQGSKPGGRPRRIWDYSIKMDLRERWSNGPDSTELA